MTASEARIRLPKFIDGNAVIEDYAEYEDVIDTVYDALDLLEKVESMEYQEVCYEDGYDDYDRGYNACLEEIKKTIGGNDDSK